MFVQEHTAVGVRTAASPQAPALAGTARHESWADLVRVLAAFLIVAIHTLQVSYWLSELPPNSLGWLVADLLAAATRWALPIFVMTSGYFLLDPAKPQNWQAYYRRRIGRIGWPLLAWTMLYLALTASNHLLAGQPIGLAEMPASVVRGIPYYHMWFLYMLPGLYLAAPFLKAATDHLSRQQLITVVTICFVVTSLSAMINGLYPTQSKTYIDEFPRYIGYFLAGHLFGRVLPPAKLAPALAIMVVSAIATAVAAWCVAELMSPARAVQVFGFANPTIIALSLAAFVVIRGVPIDPYWNPWLARAGETTLGIYLIHPALIDMMPLSPLSSPLPLLAIEVPGVFAVSFLAIIVMQRTPVLRRCV